MVTAMGMQAENMQRQALGESMAYTEEDFQRLHKDYTLVQPEKTLEEKFREEYRQCIEDYEVDVDICKHLARIAEEHYKELSK